MMALCHAMEWESKAAGVEPNHLDLVRMEGTSLCLQADSLYRFNLGPKKGISDSVFGSDLGYLKRGFKIQNDQSIYEFVNLKFGPAWMFLEGTRKHQEMR